jgi:hypothetical protein
VAAGFPIAAQAVLHTFLLDYVPFILLLFTRREIVPLAFEAGKSPPAEASAGAASFTSAGGLTLGRDAGRSCSSCSRRLLI